jgi:hypothetical protein
MESLVQAWRWLLLAGVFVFPQLLGLLLFYRLHRAPRWVARTTAILTPAVLFFFLAPILFFTGLREAAARGEMNCGMPAVAAGIIVIFGTLIQVAISLFTHVVFRPRK